mgnify:CR=1 FL=1
MIAVRYVLASSLLLMLAAAVAADEPKEKKFDKAELEKKFAETMSGATMSGHFTVLGSDKPPRKETYTLGRVYKAKAGDYWIFETRIQYGDHDVTLPLSLPVLWAGDTAVITVDKVPVPPLGVYSARVLVYNNQYAGTWDGGNHGGMLFGTITPAAKKDSDAAKDGDQK